MKIKVLFWKAKRKYLTLRHPNLQIGHGTVVVGRFTLSGGGRVVIGSNCRLVSPIIHCDGEVSIGDDGYFHKTHFVARQKIEVGPQAILSDCYLVDTDFHNIKPADRHSSVLSPKATKPIVIGSNVWIGDSGIVLKGSVIGDNAVCGSHTVVRGEIPADSIAIGNPAQIVGRFDHCAKSTRSEP